jgi:DNA-binding response OmpR family regulator
MGIIMAEEPSLILVVDDNEMNRDMLSRRLKRLGHKTMVANDGEIALQVIQDNQFDLVLLDIMMPNLNGYDTLDRIKSNEDTQHLPVIMISAVDDLESVVRCIEMGAEDYLFKPFNPVLLKARVGASLEKNRLQTSSSKKITITSKLQTIATSIQQELQTLNAELQNLSESQQNQIQKLLDSAEILIQLIGE